MPLENAFDTPAQTTQDGAGQASLPSTLASGMMRLKAGTMMIAPATTPKSWA